MGFLDKFKKKDDLQNLKEPMSDPLGQLPADPLQSTSAPADLPPPELPGINDATGSPSFGSSMDQNNTSTSAAQIPSLPKIEDSFGAQRPQSESAMSTGINEQQQSPQQQPPTASSNRDFELINSKLDNIKSLLENLNQRVAHLEQEKYAEEGNRPRRLNW